MADGAACDDTELLQKQRRRIEYMRKQNRQLDFELMQDRKLQAVLNEPLLHKDIKNCKGEIETYLRKNRQEELFIKETASTIRSISVRLQAQHRSRGGEHVTRYNNSLLSKQANILQQRLDVGMVKYNKILETNMALRERIDRTVQQREVFDKIFSRIAAEVTLVSDETTRLQEQIELVERERDAVAEEMNRKVAEAEAASVTFDKSLMQDEEARKTELRKVAREKAKLKPDSTEVVSDDEDEEEDQANPSPPSSPKDNSKQAPKVGGMTPDEEQGLLTAAAAGKWETVSNKNVINHAKEDLWAIKEFFDQLYDVTGITDVDELSKLFLESERRIFSVFRDINAVTEEIDAVQQEVAALEVAQSKHNPHRQANLLHRRAVLSTKQTLQRADQYDRKYGSTRVELAQLESHIVAMRNDLVAAADDDQVSSVSAAADDAEQSEATTESLTNSIMRNLGQIEQHMRESKAVASPTAGLAPTPRGSRPGSHAGTPRKAVAAASPNKRFSAATMQASRQKIAEVEKVVKKRLNHDAIFRDDFSDSDGDGLEAAFEGAGGLLPHSELKTKRLVRRHFALLGKGANSPGGGGGEHARRPSGTSRR